MIQAIRDSLDFAHNGSLAVAVAITGAIATDGDAANETADTVDGFSSYSTSDSDGDSQAANGEVGGGDSDEGGS